MTHSIPSDVLDRAAPETARWFALSLLDEATAARARLDEEDDAEALHDFRVALRRLRSCLRSYADELDGSVSNKTSKELRDLARASGASRDTEVHLAWLAEQEATVSARQRHGWRWLRDTLADQKASSDAELAREVRADFARVCRRLARGLRKLRITVRLDEPSLAMSGREVTGALVLQLADELGETLASVNTLDDQSEAHAARIAGKRLRYALELLRTDAACTGDVEPLVESIKTLQDLLGDVHDAHVFGETITALSADAASEHARQVSTAVFVGDDDRAAVKREQRKDPRFGLLELVRRLRHRGEVAFDAVGAQWLGGRAEEFLRDVRALGERLAEAGRSVREIERKFLLRALPEMPRDRAVLEIEQGYLPGALIHERLRLVRDADGEERWFRTLKAGAGLSRIEHEEETTREVFEAMWPLTAGCRVHKRRHEVREGDLTWQIDEFVDRDLVLA
ncbi:MAG: CHAD domain-containing protein, partial [Gemmatimonadaceae bacterium]